MEENNEKKLSYEKLKEAAGQLSQQNQQLNLMLQQMNMTNAFRRLDYLFKVLEFKDCFNSDFVISCSEEITSMMTPPEEEKDTENKEEN